MKSLFTITFLSIMAIQVNALRVELSSDTFSTTGRNSNRNLFITNNSQKMAAIEVYAQSRSIQPNSGDDILEDVEDFLIFPDQLLLQPGEQQVITITWVGPDVLEFESAYRMIVEELNLSLSDDGEIIDGQTSVKLDALAKVVKAAYVAPPNAQSNVRIIDSEIIELENGEKKLEVTFENVGTLHKIMKQTSINLIPIDSDGNLVTSEQQRYSPDELIGVINILAKSQRILQLAIPEGMNGYSSFKASL